MGLFIGSNHLNGGGEASVVTSRKDALANELRAAIRDGKYRPGAKLPTELELAKQHNVSVNTIRGAMAMLVHEGLVERRRGAGTFVRDPKILVYHASRAEPSRLTASDRADAFFAEVKAQGRVPGQSFEYRELEATPELAYPLHVPEGSLVILRRQLRLVDGHPAAMQESYYPGDIADRCRLRYARNIPGGTIARMAKYGVTEIGSIHDVRARNPTPDEVALLKLSEGSPLLININLTGAEITDREGRGKPDQVAYRWVRLTRTYFSGETTNLRYELGRLGELYGAYPEMQDYLP